jgi:hypothetical protein
MKLKAQTAQDLIDSGVECVEKISNPILKAQNYLAFAQLQATIETQALIEARTANQ